MTARHQVKPVGPAVSEVDIVRRRQQSNAPAMWLAQYRQQILLRAVIQAGHRLVEYQQLGVHGEHADVATRR